MIEADVSLHSSRFVQLSPISVNRYPHFQEEGEEKEAWYILFAHVRNYSKAHMVELGSCTNMTIHGSRE